MKTKEKKKAIQDQGQVKAIKKYAYDAEDLLDALFISKEKEIFNELVDERRQKLTDLEKNKLIAMI